MCSVQDRYKPTLLAWNNYSWLIFFQVINPNDGFFRALQDFAATECGVDYSVDENRRDTELFQYNAYQLVAQLDFTGVTLDEAVVALERKNGDINSAASSILSKFERA